MFLYSSFTINILEIINCDKEEEKMICYWYKEYVRNNDESNAMIIKKFEIHIYPECRLSDSRAE